MTMLCTAAGIALIALVVHDVFTVQFRPRAESRSLREAIDDATTTVVEGFVLHRRHDVSDAAAAYARDHRHDSAAAARDEQRPDTERAAR